MLGGSFTRSLYNSIKGMKGYKHFRAIVRGEVLRPYRTTVSNDDSSGSDHEVDSDDLIDLLESYYIGISRLKLYALSLINFHFVLCYSKYVINLQVYKSSLSNIAT